MIHAKLAVLFIGLAFVLTCCFSSGKSRFVIADSKIYEASMFRQHCAICHGPEGDGKMMDDGKQVPSLRFGEFKFKSEDEIYNQISNGGNGMTPFRGQLTERELRMMAAFVHDKLRSQ